MLYLHKLLASLPAISIKIYDVFNAIEQSQHEERDPQSILGLILTQLLSHNLLRIRSHLEVTRCGPILILQANVNVYCHPGIAMQFQPDCLQLLVTMIYV